MKTYHKHHMEPSHTSRHLDGLINPRSFHRELPKPKRGRAKPNWRSAIGLMFVVLLVGLAVPKVRSVTNKLELLDLFANGRYLVLFQNDAEIRPTGGFIGSFAVIQASERTIKPVYFETNIYKLDDAYTKINKIDPPKPLQAAIADRGWAMRDSNFAADFRQSAQTVSWFFQEEAKKVTGPKRAELDSALAGNYSVDGVVAVTLGAFLDILEATGPIELAKHNLVVTPANFTPMIQQIVERDYFESAENREKNEPKTVLQDLFPLVLQKAEKLPKTAQYKLIEKLLQEKKVIIYTNDSSKEQILVDQGWAGALELPKDKRANESSDFLAVVRSSHGGNKSSVDINPIYRYNVSQAGNQLSVKLEVTLEHTGSGQWPSGVSHEYIRVLAPAGSVLKSAVHAGKSVTDNIDIGREMDKAAFGFWLHTDPRSSQTMSLEYTAPLSMKQYQLVLLRQPGAKAPDVTTVYDGNVLFQGRLTEDRVIVSH